MTRLRIHPGWSFGLLLLLGLATLTSSSQHSLPKTARERADSGARLAGMPLYFEPNLGQANPQVKMLARGAGMFFRSEDVAMLLPSGHSSAAFPMEMKWIGGNAAPEIIGENPRDGRSHYFIGDDPRAWVTDVAQHSGVRYREVYSGIDVVFHATQGQIEYDYMVQPGADPAQIKMELSGGEDFYLDGAGNLTIRSAGNTFTHRAPVVYQVERGERQLIAGAFRVLSADPLQVGFDLAEYDHSRELVIDPVMEYGRFFGGSQEEEILSIAVDKDGFIYMSGETSSPDLPLSAGKLAHPASVFQTKGNTLAFVAKLDPTGTKLIYCTYLGGSKTAVGHNLKIDAAGNAYIGGRTEASDFPLMKPIQAKFGGGSDDGFITKLNAAGNALIYSTYLGGSEYDQGRALAVDAAGNAYLTGITESANFPVKNPIQVKYAGKQDTFALKINPAGSALVYSTYLGGAGDDVGHAITVDAAGSAYITGLTNSADFPTAKPLQSAFKGGEGDDTIVVKINPDGTALVYSTFLGGSKDDESRGIVVDAAGNATITGYTQSSDFPTAKPLQAKFGGGAQDIFVSSLRADGAALNYSTFLGGSGADYGRGLALNAAGDVYLTGYTDSKNFPLKNPLQPNYAGGTADTFYAKLDRTGATLVVSSFLGGDLYERGRGIAVSAHGEVYISGRTESKNFPVTKPHSPAFGGGPNDAFLVKIWEK